MSLFKAREFWSANLNVPDAFDANCLLIETINTRSCIFLGSHDGYMRAFCPPDGEPTSYKPSDLLYETLFPVPVLQMAMGRFVSGSSGRQLAVLHPKQISVYSVNESEDEGEHVLSLQHVYQHNLQRTSYGFVAGTFGKVEGREFFCVQSLDGLLSFFEQETATFQLQLPDHLLPLPFRYITSIDSFLFQDCQYYLKCYAYEELSQTSRKSLKPNWSHNIGDMILDINIRLVADDVNILILTEKHLYNLNQHGKIEWMKQFEYQPICFYSFIHQAEYELFTIVCSDLETLNVYDKTQLKWCAKIDFLPVCTTILNLTVNRGLIVLLSDSGLVQCVYLGTVPSLYLIPPTAEPEVNIVEAEQELKQLQMKITDTELENNDAIVKLTLVMDPKISVDVEGKICRGIIELTALTPVNNVQVFVHVEPPFVSSVKSFIVASIVSNEQISFKVSISGEQVASILLIRVIASYFLANGAARITEALNQLPFELAADSAPATKDAPVKVTLTTNKPTCPLNELFADFEASANAVGFLMPGFGSVVTIAAAKASQRFRIQGSSFEDLTMVLSTLIQRLRNHYRKSPDFSLAFPGPLPLPAYFELIEKYYEMITRRRSLQNQLAQNASQYRTLQKKVLASLNDLNARPTQPLYKVLGDTYSMIRIVISDLEKIELELNVCRSRLASLSRLIITLLNLMAVNQSDINHLQMAFSPIVYDGEEQGWLEVQNATLSLLIRTVFAKSSKDQNKPVDLTLDPLSDVSKLCKLFSTVLDRATKGSSLVERAEFEIENLPTVPSVKDWQQKDLQTLPVAAKFTDLNTRAPEKLPKVVQPVVERKMNLIETEVTIETHNWRREDELGAKLQDLPDENNVKGNDNELVMVDDDDIWDIKLDELKI